jgi:NADH-quinone oxidoreductase chain G
MMFLNGYQIEVKDWSYTLLQQCEQLGINVPRFCYHESLSIAGNCRMCMVELETSLKPVIACSTSLTQGMSVWTNSALVKKARENVLELLLINHPLDCPICDQGGECDLQDQTMVYGGDRGRFKEEKRSVSDKHLGPYIKTIMTRCIHCTRCVRFCDEILGEPALGTMGRGNATEIGTYLSKAVTGELSGNVVDLCPVGALTSKPYAFHARPWELESVESIDIFDGLGSNIRMDVKNNQIVRILPRWNQEVNEHWITDKVRYSYDGLLVERLTWPMCKHDHQFLYSSWDVISLVWSTYTKRGLGKIYTGELLDLETLSSWQWWAMQHKVLWGNQNGSIVRSMFKIPTQSLCVVDVNLKKECSVLNAKLRQQNIMVNYFGANVFSTLNQKHLGLLNVGKLFMGQILSKSDDVLTSLDTMDEINQKEVWVGGLSDDEYMKGELYYRVILNYNDRIARSDAYTFYIGHHGTVNAMNSDCILPVCSYGEYTGSYLNLLGTVQKSNKAVYVGGMMKEYKWVMENILGVRSLPFSTPIIGTVGYSENKVYKKVVKSKIYNYYTTNVISKYSINMNQVHKKSLNWEVS